MDKYANDLDIMNIISTVNKTKILMDVLLDEHQKQLLNLGESQTVNDDSTSI